MSDPQTSPTTTNSANFSFDANKRAGQYVQLRDLIKATKERHKQELAPMQAALDKLELQFLGFLNTMNMDNFKTEAGTVYRMEKVSATIADGSAFWEFVKSNELFDLIDKRANAPAVTDYLEKNGVVPPGINYSRRNEIGVRRG